MENLLERRVQYVPRTKHELIMGIVNYQRKLIEFEVKLGKVDKVADEEYFKKFQDKLEKLEENSLRKYYYIVKELCEKREVEYNNMILQEQINLYEELVQEYLESLDPEIAEILKKVNYDDIPSFPIVPTPIRPYRQNPWNDPEVPNIPWWDPKEPWRITMGSEKNPVRALR